MDAVCVFLYVEVRTHTSQEKLNFLQTDTQNKLLKLGCEQNDYKNDDNDKKD